jgi:hypothetical protein
MLVLNCDDKILDFIRKEKKDRVKFELKKNRLELLYKFADVERYFNFNKIIKDCTKHSSQEIINFLKEEKISFSDVYILSTNDKYDKLMLNFSQAVLEDLFWTGFPTIIIFKMGYMLIIGEYVMGGYSPKYLFKNSV